LAIDEFSRSKRRLLLLSQTADQLAAASINGEVQIAKFPFFFLNIKERPKSEALGMSTGKKIDETQINSTPQRILLFAEYCLMMGFLIHKFHESRF
jgi:hypothetical protein